MSDDENARPDCAPPAGARIMFYDGECGLCTGSVRYIMKRDRKRLFRFAPLQGETAARLLPPGLRDPGELSTMVYVELDSSGDVAARHLRSAAVLRVGRLLGGFTGLLSRIALVLPVSLADAVYRLVARCRGRFGSPDACRLPTPEEERQLLP